MITVYPYHELGHANFGWLDARHHFSFGRYYNQDRMGFGALRVINDDTVAPGKGFDTHPHENMEIITYVRSGGITHEDSMGNRGTTHAGDIQVMSAGTGVRHSEHNLSDEAMKMFQIWIIPDKEGVQPRWEAKEFPKEPVSGSLPTLVSGRPEDKDSGALFIHQDAAIYAGRINAGTEIVQPVKHMAYVLVSEGEIELEGQTLSAGDGAEVTDINTLELKAKSDSELLIIDVPA